MHNKKIISILTASVMACSVFSSAVLGAEVSVDQLKLMQAAGEIPLLSAPKEQNTKITRDKALAIAKTILDDANLYENSNIMLRPNYMSNGNIWSVNFFLKQSMQGNISVDVDSETGEIISFNNWQGNNGQQNYVAKLTKDEAKVNANEYIKNVLKDDLNNYEYQTEENIRGGYGNYGGVKQPVVYSFNYIKKINGIPFTYDSINIGVDGTVGKIINYRKNVVRVDTSKFPSKEGIISEVEALSKYKESNNVILQYIATYPDRRYGASKPKVKLAYIPTTNTYLVDAVTGKSINYDGSDLTVDVTAYKNLLENPVPMKKDAKLENKVLSEDQANVIAEELKINIETLMSIKFDKDDMNSMSYSYIGGVESVWNYNWNKRNGNSNISLYLAINKETGHVTNLGLSNYDSELIRSANENPTPEAVKEKINWQQSKEKALELIKTILPEQYGFFVDENAVQPKISDEQMKYEKAYNFNYTRLVKNIRFRDNTIHLNVDRETGETTNFSFTWNDLEFPDSTALITKESALKTLSTGATAKLGYSLDRIYNSNGRPITSDVPRLVYTFSSKEFHIVPSAVVIDASSGKALDYSGNPLKEVSSNNDLQLGDHWAKRSAELLTAQEIYSKDIFLKNVVVSKFDAIKLISLAKGINNYNPVSVDLMKPTFSDVTGDNEYFTFIENAVKQNIISKSDAPFNGSEIITKTEFAKLLINLIGYSDVAKFNNIFKADGVLNVPEDQIGYVALCKALDILPITPGETFDGSKQVTSYEVANALYKALAYIK